MYELVLPTFTTDVNASHTNRGVQPPPPLAQKQIFLGGGRFFEIISSRKGTREKMPIFPPSFMVFFCSGGGPGTYNHFVTG